MIDVLIVDDSIFMRTVLRDILSSDKDIRVVGTARNGREALNLIPELRPSVVTLDIEMPVMDGLSTLQEIMKSRPLPVIMLSSLTHEGAKITMDALDMGAIDYIPKPSSSTKINAIKNQLIEKIKVSSRVRVQPPRKRRVKLRKKAPSLSPSDKIVAIGASTGGPKALVEVLSGLPENIPPTLVVQHMPSPFTTHFAARLDKHTLFKVKEAEEGDRLEEGLCLLAPGDWHMNVTKTEKIHLHKGPPKFNLRPTVDEMMVSTAERYGDRTVGVILTGMGDDGVLGMKEIRAQKGFNIAQDERTCVIFGMPKAAIRAKVVDLVAPLDKIADEIVRRCW